MIVIGLAGRICSGKNLMAEYLSGLGFTVVDVDRLGHKILDREVDTAAAIFGSDIIKRDGGVDRKILSQRVFSHPDILKKLENFLHPLMVETCKNIINTSLNDKSRGIVLNAAVLSRMRLDVICDSVIFVTAPLVVRFLRAKASRGMQLSNFLNRNRSQKDIVSKNLSGHYEIYTVRNIGSTQYLYKKLDSIVKLLDSSN